MSFPLNRIFQDHSSYSIEYKLLIMNMEIQQYNITTSKAYFQHEKYLPRVKSTEVWPASRWGEYDGERFAPVLNHNSSNQK